MIPQEVRPLISNLSGQSINYILVAMYYASMPITYTYLKIATFLEKQPCFFRKFVSSVFFKTCRFYNGQCHRLLDNNMLCLNYHCDIFNSLVLGYGTFGSSGGRYLYYIYVCNISSLKKIMLLSYLQGQLIAVVGQMYLN